MYLRFYGIEEKPFQILPDPDFMYMSQGHDNAYTHLEYSILENKGFVVVTGEIGSGKTTLINHFLKKVDQSIHIGLVSNPYVPSAQLMKLICRGFSLDVMGIDKSSMIEKFYEYLLKKYTENRRVVLIIDEAQNLTHKGLEEIRMLSNLDSEKQHLIQIILVGQPELRDRLRQKNMRQFTQRVTVHCHLDALKNDEVENYIKFRLKAGGAARDDIFDGEAIESISAASGGIPRIINSICDTALVYGYAEDMQTITEELIKDVLRDRDASGIHAESKEGLNGKKENTTIHYGEPLVSDSTICRPIAQKFEILEKRLVLIEKELGELKKNLES